MIGMYYAGKFALYHAKQFYQYAVASRYRPQFLRSRYGSGWAIVLNTVDQLGNEYCYQLAHSGFNLILCGSPTEYILMVKQSTDLAQLFKIKTKVVKLDYKKPITDQFEEIKQRLQDLKIRILINNQTLSVPIQYACWELHKTSAKACILQIQKNIICQLMVQLVVVPKMLKCEHLTSRSAIVTLTSETEFVGCIQKGASFPVLQGAMSFNRNFSEALHNAYQYQSIDVM